MYHDGDLDEFPGSVAHPLPDDPLFRRWRGRGVQSFLHPAEIKENTYLIRGRLLSESNAYLRSFIKIGERT